VQLAVRAALIVGVDSDELMNKIIQTIIEVEPSQLPDVPDLRVVERSPTGFGGR
jgi:hypothetical protein